MIHLDDVIKENIKNVIHIGHKFLIIHIFIYYLITEGSVSEKTNSFFNLISQQPVLIKFIYTLKIHIKQNINV